MQMWGTFITAKIFKARVGDVLNKISANTAKKNSGTLHSRL